MGGAKIAVADKEAELVERAKRGDGSAFEALVSRYAHRVYNLAYRMLGNKDDAEDVLQETFLRAYKNLSDFRGEGSFLAWILQIATNISRRKIRNNGRMLRSLDEEIELEEDTLTPQLPDWTHASPEKLLMDKELQEYLQKAINTLPEKYRTVFVLRDLEGFSTQAVAKMLGITENNVKQRLHRARLALRKMLEEYFKE